MKNRLKSFEKLSRLDPAARVISSYNRARIFLYRKNYEKALAELDRGAKQEPNHPLIRVFRSAVLFYMGHQQEAMDMIADVLAENPQMDGIRPLYAIYLAGSGKDAEALEQLSEDALALSKADHDMAYWVGAAYARLGEKDLAFKWFERAVRLGNENKPWYEADSSLDSLRDDERYQQLLAKMNN